MDIKRVFLSYAKYLIFYKKKKTLFYPKHFLESLQNELNLLDNLNN